MILIEKKPKRAEKQFRRNVALLFLSYYRPLSVCLSLSLSLFVLSFPTKQKKISHSQQFHRKTNIL